MLFIVLLYYGILYPAKNTGSLGHAAMNDYDQDKIEGHSYQKRDLNPPESEEYIQEEYYYDAEEGDVLRNKRNLSASSNDVTASTIMNIASEEVTVSSPQSSTTATAPVTSANTTTHKSIFGHHSTTTQSPDEYDPDFHLGNVVMDAVFRRAEESDMKQALGLCRKNADIKVPQFKASLFPGEQAADILNCINDLLRNQTKKQICLHLDAEMSAYLKWLVLTGESKERHKPVKIAAKEDFLFPSSCVSEQSAVTPECLVEPVVRDDFEE